MNQTNKEKALSGGNRPKTIYEFAQQATDRIEKMQQENGRLKQKREKAAAIKARFGRKLVRVRN